MVSGTSRGNASPCSAEHPVRTVVLLSAIATVSPATVTMTLGVPPHDASRIARMIAASGRRDRILTAYLRRGALMRVLPSIAMPKTIGRDEAQQLTAVGPQIV